jgi:hypothetical protein
MRQLAVIVLSSAMAIAMAHSERQGHADGNAQASKAKKSMATDGLSNKFKSMAYEVNSDTPTMNQTVLKQNAFAVQSSDKEIRAHLLQSGFKDRSIDRIELAAWMQLNANRPDASFTDASFKTYALTHFGGLQVQSTPTGAAVWVNNDPWGPTTAEEGVPIGKKHIKIHLDGYLDSEGDVEITAGKMAIFQRVLQKKPESK